MGDTRHGGDDHDDYDCAPCAHARADRLRGQIVALHERIAELEGALREVLDNDYCECGKRDCPGTEPLRELRQRARAALAAGGPVYDGAGRKQDWTFTDARPAPTASGMTQEDFDKFVAEIRAARPAPPPACTCGGGRYEPTAIDHAPDCPAAP